MSLNTTDWNRVRYTAYAPFYDAPGRPFQKARRRAIDQLELQAGERVLTGLVPGLICCFFLTQSL